MKLYVVFIGNVLGNIRSITALGSWKVGRFSFRKFQNFEGDTRDIIMDSKFCCWECFFTAFPFTHMPFASSPCWVLKKCEPWGPLVNYYLSSLLPPSVLDRESPFQSVTEGGTGHAGQRAQNTNVWALGCQALILSYHCHESCGSDGQGVGEGTGNTFIFKLS